MSSIAQPASPPNLVPTIYRLQRRFFAASIVLGAAAIVVAAFANPPYYGSGPGTASAVATNAADSDLMDQTHVVAQLLAAFLLPIGFLVMAWLANRRAPWLASIGAGLSVLGFLPLALYVGQDAFYYDIARWGSNPQFIDLAQRWNTTGVMAFYGIAFGVGSVFGPTLLGIALWRARAIPVWAAICLILSRLSSFVFGWAPFHVLIGIVLAGVVLLLISSLPITLAVLRAPYQASQGIEEQLAPLHSSM
jgi:hypothetical protein